MATKTSTKMKTAATAKKKATASVSNAKKAVKNFKFQDFLNSVAAFFKNLPKTYYVGILAVLGIILFFMPWLNITVLTKLYHTLNIDFLSGFFAIPQTLMSLFFSVDTQINTLTSIVDKFATINNNLDSLHDVAQYVNMLCAFLGVNVSADGQTVNEIIAAIQNALPSPEQLLIAEKSLSSVGSMVKGASAVTMFLVLLVVGFNVYAAIVCFAKKKITKGCIAAFIIECVFVSLFIIICLVVNSVIQSMIFFLPNVLEPTGWTWLTLIVCIVGIILCVKFKTKKAVKK